MTMNKITINDLMSLEQYSKERNDFRKKTMLLKTNRFVYLGDNLRLIFENRQTIFYQVQEMLRIEKIFVEQDILEELNTYNPLIPDGTNLKATMMLEYDNIIERKEKLSQLIDIEKQVYLQIANGNKIYPITNEDLERTTTTKTSAVHFMRFELSHTDITAFKDNKKVIFSVNHPKYQAQTQLTATQQQVLMLDFA